MAREERITLAHGNGGRLMHALVDRLAAHFTNKVLEERADAAEVRLGRERLAFTTDSYVVDPLFFPGGDIGSLAVFGTVNDIAMKGAVPLYISLGLICEEGLPLAVLDRVARSVAKACRRARVRVVTGDIKVVERGAAQRLFVNTSGIGVIRYPRRLGVRARPGDAILLNGGIAEHGMAIFRARHKMGFVADIKSDAAPLNGVVGRCLAASGRIRFLRDVTRGGLATTLNEIARVSRAGIEVREKDIPVRPVIGKMCDVLGFDPLYIPCEGRFVCCVDKRDAVKVKKAMGPAARLIGRVTGGPRGEVRLRTRVGAGRLLPVLEQDQLPRIC